MFSETLVSERMLVGLSWRSVWLAMNSETSGRSKYSEARFKGQDSTYTDRAAFSNCVNLFFSSSRRFFVIADGAIWRLSSATRRDFRGCLLRARVRAQSPGRPGPADIVGDSGNGGDEPCGHDLPHGLNRLRHIFHAC